MNDQSIKRLIDRKEFDKALELCEERVRDGKDSTGNVLRQRAYLYARDGNYESALADRETIIESGEAKLQDFFQAGNAALFLCRFDRAESHFLKLIEYGSESSEDWFAAAAHFLAAYAQLRLRKPEEALSSVSIAAELEASCEMPIPHEGVWDIQTLRSRIEHSMA